MAAPGSMRAEELTRHAGGSAHWREVLEQRWQRKLDEVIILSRACYDSQAPTPGGVTEGHGMAAGRLALRLAEAHEELAEIGATIEVIAADSPMTCDRCGRAIPYEWVIEDAYMGECPDCALDSVRWPRESARSRAAA